MFNILSENKNINLAYARAYVSKGWKVFPCYTSTGDGKCSCGRDCGKDCGKHPRTAHGYKDATIEAEQIQAWWSKWPDANIGIATGEESDLLIVDTDPKDGGPQSLATLQQQHGHFPPTLTVQTGSGGRYYYFKYPKCRGITIGSGLVPGVDWRGDGGYVIAPPSLHKDGKRYAWTDASETPLADAPNWLVQLLKEANGKSNKKTLATSPQKSTGSAMILTVTATPDLSNSPGVSEGQRNATLCRLIGVHLAKNENPEQIEPLALAWAEKCDPPLTESQVLKCLASLARADANKREQDTSFVPEPDEIEDLALPEPEPWPVLHADAYYGLAGDITRAIEPQTEADGVGVLLSLLVAFGNVVGRNPHYLHNATRHGTNLDTALVGSTSDGKGEATDTAHHAISPSDADWSQRCIVSGLSSAEGLAERVRDAKTIVEDGKVLTVDPGATDKRLLIVETEFSRYFKANKREGNPLSETIRQAWDGKSLQSLTRAKNSIIATDPHISIIGHITPDELRACLSKSADIANGFATRFLWCLVRSNKCLPHGGDMNVLAPYLPRLTGAVARAKTIGRVVRSQKADDFWAENYPLLKKSKPGSWGRATDRARPQTLRLSMVYALLDGSATIQVEHIRAALAMWRYCEESARIIFGGNNPHTDDALEERLLAIIRANPGITRTGIYDATHRNIPKEQIVKALARLRDKGLIYSCDCSTGGRPAECWYPATYEQTK